MKREYAFPLILVLIVIPSLLYFRINIFKPDTPPKTTLSNPSPTMKPLVLTGTTWEWVETKHADGSVVRPADPTQFHMTLSGDTMQSTTDCNQVHGSYIIDQEVLSFAPLSATKMYCADSNEALFTADFPLITSYHIQGNNLTFILIKDAGEMKFRAVSNR